MTRHGPPGGSDGTAPALKAPAPTRSVALSRETPTSPTTSGASPSQGALLRSRSPLMSRVLSLAGGVAETPATVLITGESGTGKEVLARMIHDGSPRASRAFVAINCGALPPTLVESELFGHERGAFSGATERRVGRVEAAHRGTLLLDEISEMPLALQTRLLRVLQEREVQRIGSSSPVQVDVRVIATTNRDIKELVARGAFREDLFYRIHVFPIHVPPLRERLVDVPELAEVLLRRLAIRFDRACPALVPGAVERLMAFGFPGNVRQLANVLERAIIIANGEWIHPEHLLLEAEESRPISVVAPVASSPGDLRTQERGTILNVLAACDGNRTHAARQLGISIRTLRNRLREYRSMGVEVPAPNRGVGTASPSALPSDGTLSPVERMYG